MFCCRYGHNFGHNLSSKLFFSLLILSLCGIKIIAFFTSFFPHFQAASLSFQFFSLTFQFCLLSLRGIIRISGFDMWHTGLQDF